MTARVPIAFRPAFGVGGSMYVAHRPHGDTILQIVDSVPNLPAEFKALGAVSVNGQVVPRELWGLVRPKPTRPDRPVAVVLHPTLHGGGGKGSGKTIVSLVAALALVVVTAGIGSGAILGGLSTSIGTSLGLSAAAGAQFLAGAVGLAGALAIAALTPPPSLSSQTGGADTSNGEQKQSASASGNTLNPGGAIPRVIGTRKLFPPLVGEPIVELVDEDEYVEAAYAANGPHAFTDPRVAGVSIADAGDIEYEIREGWDDDEPLTLTARQGKSTTPQITLSAHKVDTANQDKLTHPSNPDQDLPVWHSVASRSSPDEIWLHFLLPSGMSINGSTTTDVAVPIRIRFRKKGAANWTNGPEFHLSDSTLQQRRRAVLLKFTDENAPDVPPPQQSGFVYASINVPAQTAAPATTGWDADSYFIGASGSDYLNSGNVGSSKVQNVALYSNRVELYLDPATFTPGIYEVEVIRGAAYKRTSFTDSTYSYSGSVKDFFTYAGTSAPAIPMTRANLADMVQLIRVVSIWNEHPVQQPGLALLAIRARNRDVRDVSVIASGYVKDWDGDGWNTWTTTSNPAPHYRDILSGALNLDPLPNDLRDDDALVAWRTLCASEDWTCDAIIDDFRTQDALTLAASCAYAKPYQSDLYGVTVDKDRSADDPCQVFSRRNSANMRYEKAFARVPDGFIVNYVDKDDDYENRQVVVYQRDRSFPTTGLLETITLDGLVDRDKVIARAQFDLDQGNLRSTFYYFDTDVESIVCRRGDLIGLQHDVLTDRMGDALIKRKILNDSDEIVALELDSTIPTANEPAMEDIADMTAVEDMTEVGLQIGIAVRHNDGTISTHALSDSKGETDLVHLETAVNDVETIVPQNDNPSRASMIVAGKLSAEYLRLLVSEIKPSPDLNASLTAVDEAPDLVRYAA